MSRQRLEGPAAVPFADAVHTPRLKGSSAPPLPRATH
jgi:hypothetical protein